MCIFSSFLPSYIFFLSVSQEITKYQDLKDLGCWLDKAERTMPTKLGVVSSVLECKEAALLKGWDVFALQNGNVCRSSDDASSTYNKYGESDACEKGEGGEMGGPYANRVFGVMCPAEGVIPTSPVGTVATYMCGDGSILIGSNEITCELNNGAVGWSGVFGENCEAVTCNKPVIAGAVSPDNILVGYHLLHTVECLKGGNCSFAKLLSISSYCLDILHFGPKMRFYQITTPRLRDRRFGDDDVYGGGHIRPHPHLQYSHV